MATIQLTTKDFKEKVFNYETEKDWKCEGVPACVEVYADWCGPWKMVAPILEELSKEFENRLVIYKVNTDREQELSSVFGIQSIPTMLFIGLFMRLSWSKTLTNIKLIMAKKSIFTYDILIFLHS